MENNITEQHQKWLDEAKERELFGMPDDMANTLLAMAADVKRAAGKPQAGCCGAHSRHACCGRYHK